ncbi:hypothetical protein J2X76_003946 [Neorhizobium sp. 2083]|nr:hypothetical protein [Neorhizobium sp. 2083]
MVVYVVGRPHARQVINSTSEVQCRGTSRYSRTSSGSSRYKVIRRMHVIVRGGYHRAKWAAFSASSPSPRLGTRLRCIFISLTQSDAIRAKAPSFQHRMVALPCAFAKRRLTEIPLMMSGSATPHLPIINGREESARGGLGALLALTRRGSNPAKSAFSCHAKSPEPMSGLFCACLASFTRRFHPRQHATG